MTTTIVGLFLLVVLATGIGLAIVLIALSSKSGRSNHTQRNPHDHSATTGFPVHDSSSFSQTDSSPPHPHQPAHHAHSDWGGHSHHDSGSHSHSDSGHSGGGFDSGFGDSGGGCDSGGSGDSGGGGGGGD